MTDPFLDHRPLLFSLVYPILGSVTDTEDVLQETWLAWSGRVGSPTAEPIENPRAYLVRIAVNRALDRRESINRRQEEYIGTWLPEPFAADVVPDAAEHTERAEQVSMAMLVVLETLNPTERAVFVLHEVFGYPHTEIATILGRRAPAVRQIAHRAREHVHARRPRYEADPAVRRQVTERFVAAILDGDVEALLKLLAPSVTLWADGGGKAPAAGPRPLHGPERIAQVIVRGAARRAIPAVDVSYRTVNGSPAALLSAGSVLLAVVVLDLVADSGQVCGIYTVTNPDKLSHI
ncbi:RNA polymerase sigma factor SigJ [Pseudonocardia spinosispora]|uniref:RNA polymerase sigma factor SigJ n=1 Tax=Pseudonocardia spinosispora TaxID=103441 RepID=UPI000426580D|nr:RNA polymerase sigma factor SigJ [Pseudonocardia spinosispora]